MRRWFSSGVLVALECGTLYDMYTTYGNVHPRGDLRSQCPQRFVMYKYLTRSTGYIAEQHCEKDSLCQISVKRRRHTKQLIAFDLQSTLDPCKVLFPGPMGLRPDMAHSLPYVSHVNDFQPLLHLFWQILNVLPVVVG